jgi:hypothetical protein
MLNYRVLENDAEIDPNLQAKYIAFQAVILNSQLSTLNSQLLPHIIMRE